MLFKWIMFITALLLTILLIMMYYGLAKAANKENQYYEKLEAKTNRFKVDWGKWGSTRSVTAANFPPPPQPRPLSKRITVNVYIDGKKIKSELLKSEK